jgi:hypothetical protein
MIEVIFKIFLTDYIDFQGFITKRIQKPLLIEYNKNSCFKSSKLWICLYLPKHSLGMELSNKTAREIYYETKANPQRAKFGFGKRPAIVNIDLQRAYTDTATFKTAYQTDPRQIEYINKMNEIARSKNIPVIFTYVAYMDSGEDAGVWGTRTNTPDSLQNIILNQRD